jgi:hypothetical protein
MVWGAAMSDMRPRGSNADEWHLFLSQYLDNRATSPDGLTFMAIQIAKAIAAATEGMGENAMSEAPRCPRVREPGFYRLRWNDGQMAVGYLHKRDEPRAWDPMPAERWSVLFVHETLIGHSAAYSIARDIPESNIGERIEWTWPE